MKQGIKFLMEIDTEVDLVLVRKIEFRFVQGKHTVDFVYPSDNAINRGEQIVGLVWTPEMTAKFTPDRLVHMDSRITMKYTDYNPPTEIVSFTMQDTFFK